MEWYLYLLLIAVGFIAGFINVLAGSGSTLTLPLLIFMGLPANVANGTNRIAILLQNLVAVRNFKKQEVLKTKSTWGIAIPTIIGSLIGALLAVELNNELMNIIIAILLIIMFFIILLKPSAWIKGQAGQL
ncbi:MAG: sulfite exporter TauE/SafE family protein, partial [Bacteroidales bacterium]|nr:sulfite exporter TauE/SafE family protein [Bacteroidales bacterium]